MPDPIYGFNKQDKDAIIAGIGANGGEQRIFTHPEASRPNRLYGFTLTSDMSTGTGTANIVELSNGATVESGATIKSTKVDYTVLLSGDEGDCIKQDGVYYITNANCAGSGSA